MIRNTLSNWIHNAIYVRKGDRMAFEGRMWMPAIFDTPERQRMCLMSRQVGKSTLGSAEALARLRITPIRNILYVAPEQDQARKYSQDKVKPMIEESPIIKEMIDTYNNVHEKEFRGSKKLYLKYAKHNPDGCRGITADMIHYDEIQDQDLTTIEPVINESLFTSKYKLRLYTGTPKSFANPAHLKWLESDQREWVVRCTHHSPAKWINLEIKNIGKFGPTCHYCGNLLNVDDGQWAIHNKAGKLAGFHVSQIHTKDSHRTPEDWKDLLAKLESYPEDKFLNEVMGVSADSAEMPITETMMRSCLDISRPPDLEDPTPDDSRGYTFAGIDWGHGSYTTALSIGRFDGKHFRYLHMKVYEGSGVLPAFCIPDMVRIIARYGCARVHVDYGGGFGLWDQLKDALDSTNRQFVLTGNLWSDTAKAKDMSWNTDRYSIPILTANKPKAISDYVNKLNKKAFIFPNMSTSMIQHFTNLRKEVEEAGSKDFGNGDLKVRYMRSGHDDLLQASIYCYMIARLHFASF